MKSNPAGWFEIYVQDTGRAKDFYQSVFQVKLDRLESPGMDMWAFPADMNRYGAAGSLVRMEGVPSGGNSTLVYFSCEDCAVEEGRAGKLGGRVHKKKTSIGQYGYISLVLDTEGNLIGLHSMK
jgi:uncharacterized protein